MDTRKLKLVSDEELIKRLLATGQEVYFEALYDRYFDRVYHQCLSLLKAESLAQDVAQEVFLRIYDRLGQFSFKSAFSTWLYRITWNKCMDHIRKEGKWKWEEEEKIPQAPEVADSEFLQIKVEKLQAALDKISPMEKELLMMKYGYEWQIDEIAEVTGLTEGAIKMRLKRAKEKVIKLT